MLREIIITIAFLFILSGIVVSFVVVQHNASAQLNKVEKLIEEANEIY